VALGFLLKQLSVLILYVQKSEKRLGISLFAVPNRCETRFRFTFLAAALNFTFVAEQLKQKADSTQI